MASTNYDILWDKVSKPARVEYALLEHANLLGLTDSEVVVALALYDHQGKNPDTFVGQNLLCKELGCGYKQLRTSLDKLERHGLLAIAQDHHNGRVHNRYDLSAGIAKLGFDSTSTGYHRDVLRYGCMWFGLDIHDIALYTHLTSKQGDGESCWSTKRQISLQLGLGGVHHDCHYKQLNKSIAKLVEVGLLVVNEDLYNCTPGRQFFANFRAIKPLLAVVNDPASTQEQLETARVDANKLRLGVVVSWLIVNISNASNGLKERAGGYMREDFAEFNESMTVDKLEVMQSIKGKQ